MLGAVGRIEQQFGPGQGLDSLGRMQQQFAQSLAQGRPPRLATHHQTGARGHQATAGQPLAQGLELGGLAAAIDPLQHHKAAPGQAGGQGRLRRHAWPLPRGGPHPVAAPHSAQP